MAGLATALARRGCDVHYIAQQVITPDRATQGWSQPDLAGVSLHLAESELDVVGLVAAAAPSSVHLCGGLRANGLIGAAQRALAVRGLRQWVVMETVDDAGWWGKLRSLEYMRLLRRWRRRIRGVLAIGWRTPDWVVARGAISNQTFPFAYFLPDPGGRAGEVAAAGVFRLLFAGQLIDRKRLGSLIEALSPLRKAEFQLVVAGSGPLQESLRDLASRVLPNKVEWLGTLPMQSVAEQMEKADCLVLPSRHDGWGAVISEALMAGTPVICSDACGAAGVVRASGRGGVFRSGDQTALTALLERAVAAGPPSNEDRRSLASWARCLGAEAGADYLLAILDHAEMRRERPTPPWEGRSTGGC